MYEHGACERNHECVFDVHNQMHATRALRWEATVFGVPTCGAGVELLRGMGGR